ncbi:MAG: S8 family serine peptidase, partial [Anaerolineae bacterium]
MKTKFNTLFLLITVVTLILGIWLAGAQAQPPDPPPAEPDWDAWQTLPPEIRVKVDPRLLAELRGEILPAHLGGGVSQPHVAPPDPQPLEQTRFLVYLTGQTGLKAIERRHFATKTARRQAVFNALLDTARAAQGPVKTLLEGRLKTGDVSGYQPFYIFNGFAVEGNLDTIIELARRDDVARIAANYPLLPLWNEDEAAGSPAPASGLGGLDPDNWNIDLVDADRVWNELGVTGEGAVVGGFDTGVDWDAPALQTRYRGYAPGGSDHNYNWFEPDAYLHADGNLGWSVSTVPWDCYGHGTHTMGTMVGDGGTPDTKIGMAPGAKWVAVPGICGRTMPGGVGDDIGGIKAFQWFLCPTDLSGDLSTADCSK